MTRLAPTDVTARLLSTADGRWTARIVATEGGVVAGLPSVAAHAVPLVDEGARVAAGTPLAALTGTADELAAAEDLLLGELGFGSGVATAAARVVDAAPAGLRVVCGAWKKLPPALKPPLRAGLAAGGVAPRLLDGPFVYVGKNAVVLLGGVGAAVEAAVALDAGGVAIQVVTPDEAEEAARAGAAAVMVDTGSVSALAATDRRLRASGRRDGVVLAFGGGVRPGDLRAVRRAGADVVDVGRAILSAPLLDLRFEVVGRA